ncbi:Six-hairpin glycosidase [Thozetella sp. PMI_491]|nr:Six-hairpin glycosidase [Thozetella sp. PMI_491]
MLRAKLAAAAFVSVACANGSRLPYIDYENLPNATLFPGPWDEYIRAPANKSYITPVRIYKVRGNVSTSTVDGDENEEGKGLLIGAGGTLSLQFAENIAGRVCFEVSSVGEDPVVNLAYSESPWFAGPIPDATTDRQERDLPLALEIGDRTGTVCVDPEFNRGAFKYLTINLPYKKSSDDAVSAGDRIWNMVDTLGQKVLGHDSRPLSTYIGTMKYSRAYVSLSNVWVNCTAFPSQSNGRAYSGYFYSSSRLLNRIWYAGAWTLQLSTIDPKEGSALIDYNRFLDHNESPTGSWYNNFTIAEGKAVTTDGAKRDRVVWPGDMYIAVPGIAVSTYDMVAVRNALDVLYTHQFSDGSLPYAGPPMGFRGEFSDTYHIHTLLGTYNYVLYSGDIAWLEQRWPAYLKALQVSISRVDELGLVHVASTADWLRPGMTGHNLEATAMLHAALSKSKLLLSWLPKDSKEDIRRNDTALLEDWTTLQLIIEEGLARLYCPDSGLFSDNVGRRNCIGDERTEPQDGNSWTLISSAGLNRSGLPWEHPKSDQRAATPLPGGPPTALNISSNLRSRWIKFGAPATEFPNVISPFASSFELLAHCAAGNTDAAVELALLEWGYLLDGDGFTNSTLAEGFRVDGHVQYPAYWSTARNSHAHGWASGPTGVMVGEVLGIELVKPAGEEWVVHSQLTKWLGWARGGFATVLGRFEVKLWRTIEVDQAGNKRRKGVAAEVTAPTGTKGSFRFGTGEPVDEYVVQQDDGSATRIWVQWESEEEVTVETLDPTLRVVGAPDEERWYDQVMISRSGMEVRYDVEFAEPQVETRQPGVVDWAVMEQYFKTPPPPGWRPSLAGDW